MEHKDLSAKDLGFQRRYGEFDKIVASFVDCFYGPRQTITFVSKFHELNEICHFPAIVTSYVGLTFYKEGKEIGSGSYLASWDEICKLANVQNLILTEQKTNDCVIKDFKIRDLGAIAAGIIDFE